MKTLLKILGVAVVGVVAVVGFFWLLGIVLGLLKIALVIGIFAAIGYGVIKLLGAGSSAKDPAAPPELSEAKTEESRTMSAAEKKAMSDADALRAFEDARRKQTGGNGS